MKAIRQKNKTFNVLFFCAFYLHINFLEFYFDCQQKPNYWPRILVKCSTFWLFLFGLNDII